MGKEKLVKKEFHLSDFIEAISGIAEKESWERSRVLRGLENFFRFGKYSLEMVNPSEKEANFYEKIRENSPEDIDDCIYKKAYERTLSREILEDEEWYKFCGLNILPKIWDYHIKHCLKDENYLLEIEKIEKCLHEKALILCEERHILKITKDINKDVEIELNLNRYKTTYQLKMKGSVDIETEDCLYRIEGESSYNELWTSLHLNILNLHFKKPKLRVIHLTDKGHFSVDDMPVAEAADIKRLIVSSFGRNDEHFKKVEKQKKDAFTCVLVPDKESGKFIINHENYIYRSYINVTDYIESVIKNEEWLLGIKSREWASLVALDGIQFLGSENEKKYCLKVAYFFKDLFTILQQMAKRKTSAEIYAFIQHIRINVSNRKLSDIQDITKIRSFFYSQLNDFESAISRHRFYLLRKDIEKGQQRIDYSTILMKMNLNQEQVKRIKNVLNKENLQDSLTMDMTEKLKMMLDAEALPFFYESVNGEMLENEKEERIKNVLEVEIIEAIPYIKYDNIEHEGIIIIEVKMSFEKNEEYFVFTYLFKVKNILIYKYELETKERDYYIEKARKLNIFFDAFAIARGDFNFENWVGKRGYISFEDFFIENIKSELLTKEVEDESINSLKIGEKEIGNTDDLVESKSKCETWYDL